VKVAFVYGSFAKNSAKAASDVDLIVIGSCSFGEVVEALTGAQDRLGRELNPSVYPAAEFRSKVAGEHHFLTSVLSEPKIFLMGDKDELGKLAQ